MYDDKDTLHSCADDVLLGLKPRWQCCASALVTNDDPLRARAE